VLRLLRPTVPTKVNAKFATNEKRLGTTCAAYAATHLTLSSPRRATTPTPTAIENTDMNPKTAGRLDQLSNPVPQAMQDLRDALDELADALDNRQQTTRVE
jgi:hypothetical protein